VTTRAAVAYNEQMKRVQLAVAIALIAAATAVAIALLSRGGAEIGRSATMPAATARALQGAGIQFRLAPADFKPPVTASRALARMGADGWFGRAKPQQLWLVIVGHHPKPRIAWMAVGHDLHPHRKCTTRHCPPAFAGNAMVELLNARSGNGMMLEGFSWDS
jgi:hypothetical protein